jgi:hypothetical protein
VPSLPSHAQIWSKSSSHSLLTHTHSHWIFESSHSSIVVLVYLVPRASSTYGRRFFFFFEELFPLCASTYKAYYIHPHPNLGTKMIKFMMMSTLHEEPCSKWVPPALLIKFGIQSYSGPSTLIIAFWPNIIIEIAGILALIISFYIVLILVFMLRGLGIIKYF